MLQNFVKLFCCNLLFVILLLMFPEKLEKLDCVPLDVSFANNCRSFFINRPKSFEIQIGAKVKKKLRHFEMEVFAGI
jgi:hypothetical protein